jgi:MoaA/NifB/PqqE/SkfB family radical SAM enzyme
MYKDLGLLLPGVFNLKKIRGGCSVGWAGIIIDINGDVYPCRRLPLKVGNVFEKPLSEIFFYSEKLELRV